jgi:tripeptide aminopeptidase
MKLAASLIESLPKDAWSPETTSGREGFVHPVAIEGGLESTTVQFIIRDHDTSKLAVYEQRLKEMAEAVTSKYPGEHFDFEVFEQYRNMNEILKDLPFVTDYAVEAMKKAGIEPNRAIIRGGTDGSRLSFMGLPCPNIFTGEMAIHSRHEYVSIQDMQKAVDTLVELSQIWEKHQ